MGYRLLFVGLNILFLQINCTQKKNKRELSELDYYNSIELPKIENDTLLSFWKGDNRIDITILLPDIEFKGTILALSGWDHPSSHWIDSTSLEKKASQEGYILILPSMKKTIYNAEIYPETRSDWQEEVTRTWIIDSVIKPLQKNFKILLPEQNTYILGLSTGGRGALFLSIDNSNTFDAGASLSGDFNPSHFKSDNLYRGFFGDYYKHKTRWEKDENPLVNIEQLKIPFYIGHGLKDRIVPVKHSILFNESLGEKQDGSIFHIDSTASHNYSYWNSEVDNVIDFFNSN